MRSLDLKVSTLCLLALALVACPDTVGQFDEFLEESEPYRFIPTAGECTAPVDLSGTYLLGAAVVVDPTKPIRFRRESLPDITANRPVHTAEPTVTRPCVETGRSRHSRAARTSHWSRQGPKSRS